jgi:RNA polymerase sigma-70 factor, ECF subfamily
MHARDERPVDLLAILDPRQAEIIELRFFGGLSIEEFASAFDVSPGTVKREWRSAKARLYKEVMRFHDA